MKNFLMSLAVLAFVSSFGCGASSTDLPEGDNTDASELELSSPYYVIQPGHYFGRGTWSDTTGQKGTLTLEWDTKATSTPGTFLGKNKGVFDDGKVYEGVVSLPYSDASHYSAIVNVGGTDITIGTGRAAPNSYQSQVSWSPTETVIEQGYFKGKTLFRNGTVTDTTTGVVRFYSVQATRKGPAVF